MNDSNSGQKISGREQKALHALDALGILYRRYVHPPVFTVAEAKLHSGRLPGTHCKNLFLRNKRGDRHYLVVLEQSKTADLKALTTNLREDRLSFASPARLLRYLDLEAGAVSPLGLINDSDHEVLVIIDEDLRGADRIYFHPNVNTATVEMSFADFGRFLDHCRNDVRFLPFS